jgi:hypothetical protein
MNKPVNRKLMSQASARISEWLPQIAYFNIFVLAHKNANEPSVVLSVMADVYRFKND